MRLARRMLAAMLGLLGATGTAACAAGVVGVWSLHADLRGRADRAFGRVEERVATVRDDLSRANDRLRQTRREVEAVERREEQPAGKRALRSALPRAEAESTVTQLGQARKSIVTATEVGLVANGLLDILAELPLGERVGIDTDRLHGASDQLADLIRAADRVAAALPRGPAEPEDSAADIADRVGRVVATIDEVAARTESARERVGGWHRRIVRALTAAAVVATGLLVWVALGQVCLAVQGGRWVIRRPAAAVTPPRTA